MRGNHYNNFILKNYMVWEVEKEGHFLKRKDVSDNSYYVKKKGR
jgi:hypothetical protein